MLTTRDSGSRSIWFSKAASFVLVALTALVAWSCGEQVEEGAPPSGVYQAAAQYSREHNGLAMIVYEGNDITYVDNQNGGTTDTAYHVFSGTKSFSCAIAIAAVGDGMLTTFDDVVSDTITEWQGVALKSTITVRQLLSFTSGLQQSLLNLLLFASDAFRFTAGIQAVQTPGSTFAYGETHVSVFEELMERKLRASPDLANYDPLTYLKLRVFDEVGLQYENWLRSSRGAPFMSFGAFLTAREWLKYGILLRDNGTYFGKPVLDNTLLTECLTGSAANAGYGLTFWLNAAMPTGFSGFQLAQYVSSTFTSGGPTGLIWPGGDADLFAVVGVNDHRIYVFRSRNMVVVRMGRGGLFSTWDDAAFLNKLFNR